MRFSTFKRRQAPAIIIISLIDILMVLLIFLMLTTTFKQQPALRLALPESKQGKAGASENNLILTIAKQEPFYYLGPQSISLEALQTALRSNLVQNPQVGLSIRADTDVPIGRVIKVMDIAKAISLKSVNFYVKPAGQP